VVIAARRAETGEPVAAEVRARGVRGLCIETDITRGDAVLAMVARTIAELGHLDVMVHNALRAPSPHRVESVGEDQWDELSQTAVWGSIHCARAAHPHLVASEHGRLVLVTSPAGIEASAGLPLYGPVKGAQRALAKSLAREWGPDGITVNCIGPVAVTPALDQAFTDNPELRGRIEARTPLRRLGDPELDIGGVVAFLASDAAAYVTGQTIICDGGSFTGL
jgi:3-oxoacyl-[acyl-carrier protein] reductase